LTRTPDGATLTVADDGQGFDVAFVSRRGKGLGLRSIHERVKQAGGTVSILAEVRRGTTLAVHVPLTRPTAAVGRDAAETGRS
jgi:signal transduction histidine kinase